MTFFMPHVATRVFGVPLMVDAGKAAAILTGLGGRIVDGGVEFTNAAPLHHVAFQNGRPSDSMGVLGDELGSNIRDGKRQYTQATLLKIGGVAVIPIEGTLVHKGQFLGTDSGETSYQGLQTRIAMARNDGSVRGVVFEVDSCGGEVSGAFDTAQMISDLSKEKPTLAILTDSAYSAGYLMACACRQVVMPQNGGAGSIGVITMHVDYSKQLEKLGMKVTVLSSGSNKDAGNPFEALPAEVATKIKARLDAQRDMLADAVGRYRGARLTKEAALATQADSYFGQDAIAAGLVDGIVRPTEAFSQFISLMR